MENLIDALLKLSGITGSTPIPEKVNLSSIAESIILNLKENEPERKIKIVIEKKLITKTDKGLAEVILENLLNNAWKFTGKTANPEISFGIKETRKQNTFYISDNGSGFDMKYADKLFDVFQRMHNKNEFPGSGIGLATVQRCLRVLGGKIWAEAETGKGSIFYFIFDSENQWIDNEKS